MRRIMVIAGAAALLAACSNPRDANEKNFSAAVATYLQQRGTLCLNLGQRWPVERVRAEGYPRSAGPEWLTALEAAGLVRAEEVTEAQPGTGSRTVDLYDFTDVGRQHAQPSQRLVVALSEKEEKKPPLDLCYGQKELVGVTKWEGPLKFGDYQEARIHYTYKVKGVPSWTGHEAIRQAFRNMEHELGDGPKEDQLSVKLTSEGWEAKGH